MVKEQEYIDISDLTKLRAASALLKDICPANSQVIDATDMENIQIKLYGWIDKLYGKIKIKEEK